MTTRTWNGLNGSFDNAADWLPTGVPLPGDTAVINGGVVSVAGDVLRGLTLQLNGSASSAPTLNLVGATLAAGTTLAASNSATTVQPPTIINMTGTVANQGIIGLSGSAFNLNLSGTAPGSAGLLDNTGSINIVGSSPFLFSPAAFATGALQNDGMISDWNPSGGFQSPVVELDVTGTGTLQINPGAFLDLSRSVGAGQTVDFTHGAGAGAGLQIDRIGSFHAAITGFAQSDNIGVINTPYTSFTYTADTANSGTMTLFNGGTAVGALSFLGQYQQSDFTLVFNDFGNGRSNLQITTTATPAQAFSFTDATLNLSSTDAGQAYTGPVAGLQQQYLWSGADTVAISAGVPNVFLKGGSSGDALVVSGGTNVLDGGGGSNFLVGGTGAGSADTFFVDGRGGVETWSTIVNFHLGDQATIFGFRDGTSTLPFTASDGATGYEGLTIHSELNGAGTGINGSMTFTGMDQATWNAHVTVSKGTLLPNTPDAIDYLLAQYDH